MSQSDLENEINKAVSREVQRNISIEIKPEIIPFHALPIVDTTENCIRVCM